MPYVFVKGTLICPGEFLERILQLGKVETVKLQHGHHDQKRHILEAQIIPGTVLVLTDTDL